VDATEQVASIVRDWQDAEAVARGRTQPAATTQKTPGFTGPVAMLGFIACIVLIQRGRP